MSWVSDAYSLFITLHSDNTPENIGKNRSLMLPYAMMAKEELEKGKSDEFLQDLVDWDDYFNTGSEVQFKISIDDLPKKLGKSFSKKIKDDKLK